MTHICGSKLTITGSDNGLSPDRRQPIIWSNARLLLFGPLGTNFSEILIKILTFSFKKMRLKVSSAKRRPFCLGLNVFIMEGTPSLREQSDGVLLQQATCWDMCMICGCNAAGLTHWGRDKMAAISQTIHSNAFSWMKRFEFRLSVHWNLFLRVQLTISQHWFR